MLLLINLNHLKKILQDNKRQLREKKKAKLTKSPFAILNQTNCHNLIKSKGQRRHKKYCRMALMIQAHQENLMLLDYQTKRQNW
jgi:hypothetical protein